MTRLETMLCLFCLFWLRLYGRVNNFSVMSGQSHRFLGITSTFWDVNVSCSRIQHGDPSEDPTPDLSLQSPMQTTTRPPHLPKNRYFQC